MIKRIKLVLVMLALLLVSGCSYTVSNTRGNYAEPYMFNCPYDNPHECRMWFQGF